MMLEIRGLTHRYGTDAVVEDVSFGLDAGELVALLGPSGCGKTTIVQSIAGHRNPSAGKIRLRGEEVTDDPPETRDVGVVFQEPTLFPHMTLAENVAYGLEASDVEPGRRDAIVTEYLELVSLESRRDAYPSELSGGQKRRVELARALAPEPDLLLLDEPLSALDRALREQLRGEIARIQRETGVTTLYVTHDQEDAMALADRLVVMTEGQVAGIGQPRELYESPPTPFVASFLGRSNGLPISEDEHDQPVLELRELASGGPNGNGDGRPADPGRCHVRPEDVSLGPANSNGSDVCLPGVVTRVADLGKRYDVTVQLETGHELTVEHRETPPEEGEPITAGIDRTDVVLFEDSDVRQ